MSCLGCRLANQQAMVYAVFEDEHVCCILDRDPYNEGHVLILPKKHVRYLDELDAVTANAVMTAAQLVSKTIKALFQPDGITICQNGGAFDDLGHFHLHVIPRYEGQSFADFFLDDEAPAIDGAALEETKGKMIRASKSFII